MNHLITQKQFSASLIAALKTSGVKCENLEVLAYAPGVIAVKYDSFSYYYREEETIYAVYSNISYEKNPEIFNCDFIGREPNSAMRQFAFFAANILVTGYPYQGKHVNPAFEA